ncbi:hypothetical protein BH18THE1_BH18THE1_03400 [soil metagenome]
MSNSAIADAHKVMQVLKKYSDSQIVQKILKECFEDKSADTEFSDSVPRATSTPLSNGEEIV